MPQPTAVSSELLQSALMGLEMQRQRIEEQIAQVRAMLGKRGPGRPPASVSQPEVTMAAVPRKRSKFSAEARARMAEAQRRRWAQKKGEQASASHKSPTKKRHLSAEGRKRIAEAARKRWAAIKKGKNATA